MIINPNTAFDKLEQSVGKPGAFANSRWLMNVLTQNHLDAVPSLATSDEEWEVLAKQALRRRQVTEKEYKKAVIERYGSSWRIPGVTQRFD